MLPPPSQGLVYLHLHSPHIHSRILVSKIFQISPVPLCNAPNPNNQIVICLFKSLRIYIFCKCGKWAYASASMSLMQLLSRTISFKKGSLHFLNDLTLVIWLLSAFAIHYIGTELLSSVRKLNRSIPKKLFSNLFRQMYSKRFKI